MAIFYFLTKNRGSLNGHRRGLAEVENGRHITISARVVGYVEPVR